MSPECGRSKLLFNNFIFTIMVFCNILHAAKNQKLYSIPVTLLARSLVLKVCYPFYQQPKTKVTRWHLQTTNKDLIE